MIVSIDDEYNRMKAENNMLRNLSGVFAIGFILIAIMIIIINFKMVQ